MTVKKCKKIVLNFGVILYNAGFRQIFNILWEKKEETMVCDFKLIPIQS